MCSVAGLDRTTVDRLCQSLESVPSHFPLAVRNYYGLGSAPPPLPCDKAGTSMHMIWLEGTKVCSGASCLS